MSRGRKGKQGGENKEKQGGKTGREKREEGVIEDGFRGIVTKEGEDRGREKREREK